MLFQNLQVKLLEGIFMKCSLVSMNYVDVCFLLCKFVLVFSHSVL